MKLEQLNKILAETLQFIALSVLLVFLLGIIGISIIGVINMETMPQDQSVAPDASIMVTDNKTELDEVFVSKGGWHCGIPENEDGAWNTEEDTDRCTKLLQGDIRRKVVE